MDDKDFYLIIGQRMQARRKSLGMDQKLLAKRSCITLYMLKRYEAGEARIAASTLNFISIELDVPFSYFLKETG